jgi:ribosomal protein S27E
MIGRMAIKLNANQIFDNIKCYDCENKAVLIIEMKESDIYLCEDCWSKLKELWIFLRCGGGEE